MEAIRYNIVERVLGVPLQNPDFPGFKMGAYKTSFGTWIAEHAILYKGDLTNLGPAPLVRINSACFTGDIFGDRRCDCNDQLLSAMKLVAGDTGLVIYHFHHEGRGLGFTSKLSTYKRMAEEGVSTFEATAALTNRNDLRTFGSAVLILHDLGIRRLRLVTNNPNKKFVLEKNDIEVVEVVGTLSSCPDIRQYLMTKRDEQGHFIDFDRRTNRDV